MFAWFIRLISGSPHFLIGGAERPYMLRWYLVPRNPVLNIYLHKFLRDDDDRALHDHPWAFVSVMLWGSYVEIRPNGEGVRGRSRGWLSMAFRRATDRHRVILDNGPCWTLVFTGPRIRDWGFWCPRGFVPWRDFVASSDEGNIGKGCGEDVQ